MNGPKFDEGKLRWDLLPPEAVEGVIRAIEYGASKYSERSWEQGISYSRLFAATMRHLWAFWRGEDIDRESGLLHLDCAAANIAFLQTFHRRRMQGLDDRPGSLTIADNDEGERK